MHFYAFGEALTTTLDGTACALTCAWSWTTLRTEELFALVATGRGRFSFWRVAMSWSVDFIAKSRAVAKRRVLADSGLPNLVRALIVDALDGVTGTDDKPIAVKGHGHQADGRSYEVSNCTLSVTPISIVDV